MSERGGGESDTHTFMYSHSHFSATILQRCFQVVVGVHVHVHVHVCVYMYVCSVDVTCTCTYMYPHTHTHTHTHTLSLSVPVCCDGRQCWKDGIICRGRCQGDQPSDMQDGRTSYFQN